MLLLRAAAPYSSGGSGSEDCDCSRSGDTSSWSMPTDSSASWCTKEELAPFSSSRRTR